ncbi:vitamin-D-receptor interacting mediator subunit 4-domain-containing protein [Mrakia frigida]|uniref:Med4p n=1 Tax=Mrakia frigida TaxID=29902 RepID=UPI003FCC0D5B
MASSSSSSLLPSLSVPIQTALSANISKQTALLPLLFAAISNAASGGGVSSSKHTVTQIFTDLARLDEELAVLMERARKHQQRWKRMEQLKRETIEVESQVRSALLVLEEGRRSLEMVVKDAREGVRSIEIAENNPTNPETLLSFASSLSAYTSAPPSFDPSRQPPSSFFPPFPSEYVLRSGKLNMGGGALGTVGETKEVTNTDDPSQSNGVARTSLFDAHHPLAPSRPQANTKVFDLDLNSDLDDD